MRSLSLPLSPHDAARLLVRALGNVHSGNYGHAGRPGEVGGSAPDLVAALKASLSVTTEPSQTKFLLPDGTRLTTTNTYDAAVLAATEGSSLSLKLRYTADLDQGIVRYHQYGGAEMRRPLSDVQAQVLATDWNHVYKSALHVDFGPPWLDSLSNENIGPGAAHEFSVPFTAAQLKAWSERSAATIHLLGGAGSGDYGHAGRPGEVGGSRPQTSAFQGVLATIAQPDGGFTYSPVTGESPTAGFAVSRPGHEQIIEASGDPDTLGLSIAQYAKAHWAALTESGNFMGAWHNPADRKIYLDISTVVQTAQEAERLAIRHHQIAYFDLVHGHSITVPYHDQARAASDGAKGWPARARRSHRAGQIANWEDSESGDDSEDESHYRGLSHPETLLHAAADSQVSQLEVAIRFAFAKGRLAVNAALLHNANTLQQAEAAMSAAPYAVRDTLLDVLPPALLKIVIAGGDAAAEMLEPRTLLVRTGKPKPTVTMRFDPKNDAAIQWVKQHALELAENLSQTSRKNITAALVKAFSGTLTKRELHKVILAAVGDQDRAQLIARSECLPGETLVDSAVVNTVYRRWYEGNIYDITTANGRKFTATPNHPMLTKRGWLFTHELHEGDSLICDNRKQNTGTRHNPNVITTPSTIAEIFNTAATVGIVERRRCAQPDFHGDGQESEIEVAHPFGTLEIGSFAALYKPFFDNILAPSDLVRASFCHFCSGLLPINKSICFCHRSQGNSVFSQDSTNSSWLSIQRGSDVPHGLEIQIAADNSINRPVYSFIVDNFAVVIRQFAGVGSGTSNSCVANDILNPGLVSRHAKSDFSAAVSGDVELDDVISIRLRPFSGHVYNLSTEHGYFNINGGIYTGNSMKAASEAQRQLWEQAVEGGVISGDQRRVWIVTNDERLCPICNALDGAEADLDGQYPDPGGEGPPQHPACRCTEGLVA